MHKRVAIAAAAALAACGGSSWTDPTTGSFSAQDSAEVMGLLSGSFGAVAQSGINSQMAAQNPKALSQSVTFSSTCTGASGPSGSISVTGNMDASCNAAGTSCSFNGGLQLNLNSCANPNGLVGDGQLNIGASGSSSSSSFSVHETIQGGITVHRNGTLVGTCGINVSVDVSATGLDTASPQETVHVSGTVCRQAVAQ